MKWVHEKNNWHVVSSKSPGLDLEALAAVHLLHSLGKITTVSSLSFSIVKVRSDVVTSGIVQGCPHFQGPLNLRRTSPALFVRAPIQFSALAKVH